MKEMLETGEVFDFDNYNKVGDLCYCQIYDEVPSLISISESGGNNFVTISFPKMGWLWEKPKYEGAHKVIRLATESEVFNAKNRKPEYVSSFS